MTGIKAIAKRSITEEIDNVDKLLAILEGTELTDEQKLVIPFLWFQYTVRDASNATGVKGVRIREWMDSPEFYDIVSIGRTRKREILSKYLYQAGLMGFTRIMDLLMTNPEDNVRLISEQQKTARFVVGELKMEPDKIQQQVDARVLDVADGVEDRIAEIVSGQVIDTMPKLLTLPCVEEVQGMSREPRHGKMYVYYTGQDLLLQCHECEGWFPDLEEHIGKHNISAREYCGEHGIADEVFNSVEYEVE